MVNWEAIGAISEIVGALAVVVTLLYVARQIQQNSQSLQLAALRDTTSQWNLWSETIASSPDLAEIVVRGNRSYKQLPEEHALRYGAYLQMFFDGAESYREMVTDLMVQKDIDVLIAIVSRRLQHRGFVEWWNENKSDYDAEFQDWIEHIIKKDRIDGGDDEQ